MSLTGLLLRGFGPTSETPPAPAVPVLAVADSGTGSAAVATITESTSGATNVVQVQPTSTLGAAWTNAGTRSGNGTVNLTLARGFYWGRVASTKDGLTSYSNNVYFAVTYGDDAIQTKILNAMVALVQGLSLEGVNGENIVARKLPYDRDLAKPCVILSPQTETANPSAGTNERNDIDYRIAITFAAASNGAVADAEALNAMLLWRQRVRSAIHNRPVTVAGLTTYRGIIEPGTVYVPESFAKNADVGFLVARITSRELPNL